MDIQVIFNAVVNPKNLESIKQGSMAIDEDNGRFPVYRGIYPPEDKLMTFNNYFFLKNPKACMYAVNYKFLNAKLRFLELNFYKDLGIEDLEYPDTVNQKWSISFLIPGFDNPVRVRYDKDGQDAFLELGELKISDLDSFQKGCYSFVNKAINTPAGGDRHG